MKEKRKKKYLSDKGYYVIGVPPEGAVIREDTKEERKKLGCWNIKADLCDCPACGGFND